MKKTENSKAKKILSISLNVLSYLFFAICLVALFFSIKLKLDDRDNDGAVDIFGMQMRIVQSDSMAELKDAEYDSEWRIKNIPVRSMIFIETVPEDEAEAEAWYAELKNGDVLTFRYLYTTQETITHRIVNKYEKEGGGYIFELEGDNKASESAGGLTQIVDTTATDSPNYVIGKVVSQSYPLGLLITAVKSPIGIICMVMLPCFIIAIIEVIRLIGAVTEGKKKKEKEEAQKRDEEFEAMKKQLEELRKRTNIDAEAQNSDSVNIENGESASAENSTADSGNLENNNINDNIDSKDQI